MNDCCKLHLKELLKRLDEKFSPLFATENQRTPMTEEQWGMFQVFLYVCRAARFLAWDDSVCPHPLPIQKGTFLHDGSVVTTFHWKGHWWHEYGRIIRQGIYHPEFNPLPGEGGE
jgi:hypothetical protein